MTTNRIRATTANFRVGSKVFTSRTGTVTRTVTRIEDQPGYPEQPLIHAPRDNSPSAMAMVFGVSELWVKKEN